MKVYLGAIIAVLLILAGSVYFIYPRLTTKSVLSPTPVQTIRQTQTPSNQTTDVPTETVLTEGLDTPWAIAFLPDNNMLVNERPGRVRLVDASGKLQDSPVTTLKNVKEIGEGGLLGIALHPDFANNNYLYLYYTYTSNGDNTLNRVVRMTYKNNQLSDEKIIVDNIPGSSNHNGGRIKFGPDKFLYITTGDAENPSQAQDKNALGGKILRVTDEGKPAPENPFNNLAYSYGHRNPQGITWDTDGNLWETEHGPSGGEYGTAHDEFNSIQSGKNYGWPVIIGDKTKDGMEPPFLQSGTDTWAPGDVAYYSYSETEASVFFGGLRGSSLYELGVKGNSRDLKTHLKGKYGRIREVILGPDNMLYITTSNRDGRGLPGSTDDRIIKINPQKL